MNFPNDQYFEYLTSIGGKIIDYGTLSTERDGLQSATATYKIARAKWRELPVRKSVHPIFKNLTVERAEVSLSGPFAIATCNYYGIEGEETDSVYDLDYGGSEDPIATHPDFKELIGGTATAPKNGANFKHPSIQRIANAQNFTPPNNAGWSFDFFDIQVPDANFIGPRPPATELNPFAGVQSYLASAMTWRRSWCRKESIYDLSKVNKIDQPEGPCPLLNDPKPIPAPKIDTRFLKDRQQPKDPDPGPRNWLLIGITQQQKGQIFQCTKIWRASGPRGWLEPIYKYRPPAKKK